MTSASLTVPIQGSPKIELSGSIISFPRISRRDILLAYAGLVAFAFLACWVYRQPPKLGDDLDYWSLAMDLHLGLPGAWNADSFHDLRWPVWGLCWLLMIPFGFVPATYFLQPALYLAAGACLVFWIAGRVSLPFWGRLAAGVFFVMHPLIDTALMRPMPDLSEGFWVALSFALWLGMTAEKRVFPKVLLCLAIGVVLGIAQANRITGVFAIPVLVVCTLLFYPRQIGWLMLCGVFALGFVAVEAFIYWNFTGDWLHSLNANLGARGRKGTEAIPLWMLPFRFMGSLWRLPVDVFMSSLAVGGILYFFKSRNPAGRALVVYGAVYFLSYSCAVQGFSPPRPLVRDGDRFLASLAFPLSILSVGGILLLWNFLPAAIKGRPFFQWLERKPWIGLFVFVPVMVFAGDRTTGVPNYLEEIREVILAQKPGAVIVSHPPMRAVAQLAAPNEASALNWKLFKNVLQPNPDLTQALAGADGLWLIRKHAWISNRKRSEEGNKDQLSALASYLVPPFDGWFPARSVLKGDVPDFLFLERSGSSPEPVDISRFLPSLPARWDFDKQPTEWKLENQTIPEGLAGRELYVFLRYASDRTEPVRLWLEFENSDPKPLVLTFKPYLFRDMSPDFFAFRIPSNATSFSLRLKVSPSTKWLEIERMEIFAAPEAR